MKPSTIQECSLPKRFWKFAPFSKMDQFIIKTPLIQIVSPSKLVVASICRVRKNLRDIYFLMLTRPGHFFLYLSVAVPVVRNWLIR